MQEKAKKSINLIVDSISFVVSVWVYVCFVFSSDFLSFHILLGCYVDR